MELVRIKEKQTLDEFQEEGRDFFSEIFNSIVFTLGIRKPLERFELQIIFDFIRSEYKTLTLNEIQTAFRLYSARKLDFKDSHFQSFDNPFIGSVLSSYKEYKRRKQKEVKSIPVEMQIENKVNPEFEQEKAFKFIEKVITETKEPPRIANYSDAFLYLERTGLVKLTNQEKQKIYQEERNKVSLDAAKRRLKGERINQVSSLFNERNLINQCRKRIVLEWLLK